MKIEPRPTRSGEWALLVPLTIYRARWRRGRLIVRQLIEGRESSFIYQAFDFRHGLQWVKLKGAGDVGRR